MRTIYRFRQLNRVPHSGSHCNAHLSRKYANRVIILFIQIDSIIISLLALYQTN